MSALTDPENDQKVDRSGVEAGIDQAEAFANDPANASSGQAADKAAEDQYASNFSRLTQGLARVNFRSALKRRGVLIGGGGVGLVALMIAGFIALLPLKMEAIIKNVIAKEGARVENSIDHRADRMALQYLAEKAGITGLETPVVRTGLLSTLYANWSKARFEKTLLNKYGIKMEAVKDVNGKIIRGRMKLTSPSGVTELGQDKFGNFIDASGKGSLSSREARAFVDKAVKEETHFLQIYKRRHLRLYIRNAFGYSRWKIFDRKTGKDASTNLDQTLSEAIDGPIANREGGDLSCVLESNSNCPSDSTDRSNPDGTSPERPPVPTTGEAIPCQPNETQKQCDARRQQIANNPADNNPDQPNAGKVDTALRSWGGSTGETIADILQKEIAKKVIAAGAGIGALDLLAHVDKGLWNNTFGAIVKARREIEYAATFSSWAVMADQLHTGDLSGDELNAAMTKLNGAEKSVAFNRTFMGNQNAGVPVAADAKVGSGGSAGVANDISQAYRDSLGLVIHPVAVAYLDTVGGVVHFLSDITGGLVSKVTSIIPGVSQLAGWLGDNLAKLLNYVVGTLDLQKAVGPTLMAGIDGGGDVVYNDFGRDSLGMPRVSGSQASMIDSQISASQDPSLGERLFSTDYAGSVINRFAAGLPGTPSAAMEQSAGYMASLFINPLHWLTNLFPSAAADSNDDPYGIQQYGYTDDQLNQPLALPTQDVAGPPGSDGKLTGPDGKIDAYDCPQIKDDTQPNLCLLDVATAQSLNSMYTTEDDGGIGDGGAAPATSGLPSGDTKTLAKQVLSSSNIQLLNDALIDVEAASNGHASPITCTNGTAGGVTRVDLKPQLLAALLSISQKYKIGVGYITGGCHTTDSYHYSGAAADIDLINGSAITAATLSTSNIAFGNDLAALLPSGSAIGQQACGFKLTLPTGVTQFPDPCNHIHFQVPR